MAKKKKNTVNITPRRMKDKMRFFMRDFNLVMLAYCVVIILCTLVGRCGDYDLGSANLHGFALWFLLIPAYLVLEVLSLINYIGKFNWDCTGLEAEVLGVCNFTMALILWFWVWFRAKFWSVQTVKNIRTFVLILVFWGMFQLGCCTVLWTWHNGGFSSFNRHLSAEKSSAKTSPVPKTVKK